MRTWGPILAAFVAACGGSQDGSILQEASTGIEGVWSGTQTDTVYVCIIFACVPDHTRTTPAIALAAADGRIHIRSAGSSSIVGSVRVSDGQVSGRLHHVCDPLDGPPILGHVDIDGSFASRKTLDLSYSLDECIGHGVFNLQFDPVSYHTALLPIVAGTWSSQNTYLNIDPDGEFLGADDRGCQFSGSIIPNSSTVNIYDVSMQIENCESSDGQYSGLATVFPGESEPPTLVIDSIGSRASMSLALRK